MKNCSKCKLIKQLSEFSPDKRTATGCQSRCKVCMAEHRRIKHLENPEHYRKLVAESVKRNYQKKLASNQQYRQNNSEKVKFWKQKDREINRVRVLSDGAFRRAKKLQRTPQWANKQHIQEYYETAQGLSMMTGEWYHVDHIVPLLGKNVCGLHVEHNLQIITAKENLKKGNVYA
jgi:hypothetical protein